MSDSVVTVFGSGTAGPRSREYQRAFALGAAIAQAGWALCNGGYGGTMEAAARGAAEAGGHTIGVTCRLFRRSGPNAFIRQEVPTPDLFARLETLIRLGRAYVLLPGGTGTLAELALVWELRNKRLLRGTRPIVLLGDYWQTVVDCVRRQQPDAIELVTTNDVHEAIARIRSVWQERQRDENPSASP